MMTSGKCSDHGAWNPGLRSPPPRTVEPLCTLYRAENVFDSLEEVRALSDFTGLPQQKLVTFRPQRLAIHELLIRIAADVSVPDGPGSEDLGINFRQIAATIENDYIAPQMGALVTEYDELRVQISDKVLAAVDVACGTPNVRGRLPQPPARGWLTRLGLIRTPRPSPPTVSRVDWENEILRQWRAGAQSGSHEDNVVAGSLLMVMTAIHTRHGRFTGDSALLAKLVTNQVCNVLGAERIGKIVERCIDAAIEDHGIRRLPTEPRPVVMNTKGASASGKSSMRPLQRALATRIGVSWTDFAVVSPDIFRKYLLDYDSLGEAYKYAGMLTGEELRVIDHKLDRHIAEKAARGEMPHLLIDRFRFDSFAPESKEPGSNLLTRFGAEIFMFFMVTPPHLTVDRAWERGLRVGRFKTVDDLLYHNIEAYSGMPGLFFTWAQSEEKTVHYEFLDNSVASHERPRTIAFGADGSLVVLDVPLMLDIDRHRKINVDACTPDAVYPDADTLAPARNLEFLRACVTRLACVEFADFGSGCVYLRVTAGKPEVVDWDTFAAATRSCDDTATALDALFPGFPGASGTPVPGSVSPNVCLDPAAYYTLGRWGTSA